MPKLRWECFDCGNTVSEEDALKADAHLERMFGSLDKVPLRADGEAECPKCESHNVKQYTHA